MTSAAPVRIHQPQTQADVLTLLFRYGIISGAETLRTTTQEPKDFEALAQQTTLQLNRLTEPLLSSLGVLLAARIRLPRRPQVFLEAIAGISDLGERLAEATLAAWNAEGRKRIGLIRQNGEREGMPEPATRVVVIDGVLNSNPLEIRRRQAALHRLRKSGFQITYVLTLFDQRQPDDCGTLYNCRSSSLFILSETLRQYWRLQHFPA